MLPKGFGGGDIFSRSGQAAALDRWVVKEIHTNLRKNEGFGEKPPLTDDGC